MSVDLYSEHFGFENRPFAMAPDPDFLLWTNAHSRAFAILQYGVMTRAPLTVVTGEVGVGKTTLVQAMLRTLGDDVVLGLISNAQGGRDDLLRWVLNALNVSHEAEADYVTLFQHFQDFVIETYAGGKHVVLVLDEAQNLGIDTLEELRMLTNINSGKDELLQLILVGQPELREMIERPQLRQFAQRVSAAYHLTPLSEEGTVDYIKHRLTKAGGSGDEISETAAKLIHEESGGVPRIINKIAELALVYGASDDSKRVGVSVVRDILSDGIVLRPGGMSSATEPFSSNRSAVKAKAAK